MMKSRLPVEISDCHIHIQGAEKGECLYQATFLFYIPGISVRVITAGIKHPNQSTMTKAEERFHIADHH